MRGFGKLLSAQMKLFLREPAATFFTIVFAPMLLLLFGTIYGNKPNPVLRRPRDGRRLGPFLHRDHHHLRRLHGHSYRHGLEPGGRGPPPLPHDPSPSRGVYRRQHRFVLCHDRGRASRASSSSAKAVYGMKFDGNVLSVWAGFTLGALAFFSLGYLFAGAAPTARVRPGDRDDLRLPDDVPERVGHPARGPSARRPRRREFRSPDPRRDAHARALGGGRLGKASASSSPSSAASSSRGCSSAPASSAGSDDTVSDLRSLI